MNLNVFSIFVRQLSSKYDLPDPADCLQNDAPLKSEYKETVLTKITAFYEKELRQNSQSNSSMKYLNVSVRVESTCHILTQCSAYADIRQRIFSKYGLEN